MVSSWRDEFVNFASGATAPVSGHSLDIKIGGTVLPLISETRLFVPGTEA
jgi:hypothetical protein